MTETLISTNRRQFARNLALGAAALTTPGLLAEELIRTPPVSEGPFYPDKLPLDTDNDLLAINDAITPAAGRPSSCDDPITRPRPVARDRLPVPGRKRSKLPPVTAPADWSS